MQKLVLTLAGLVIVAAIGWAVAEGDRPPPPEHGGQTRDRLNDTDMERLVAGPLKRLKKRDIKGAQAEFEADLAKVIKAEGPNSLAVADRLAAFGVQLRHHNGDKESVAYLARAVPAYRAAAGPDSPELALAMTDYVLALLRAHPDDPPAEALALAREALRIRRRSLGEANAETAAAYIVLGRIEGLRINTQGDPARIEAAAGRIRTGQAALLKSPNAKPPDLPGARAELVRLYARNGQADRVIGLATEVDATDDAFDLYQLGQFAKLLEAAGDRDGAARLRERFGVTEETMTRRPTQDLVVPAT